MSVPDSRTALLGGLSPSAFLHRHWHKRPLLIRNAMPDFLGFLTPAEIKRLATHPDVQSRLVVRQGRHWHLQHGPFRPIDLKTLPARQWTLLVQELNHWIPAAARLLDHFSFIPHARLDDLMVSYAAPGGGVGPHFDSYDVFLLQGFGTRRWSIAETDDLELRPNSALKLLRRFTPQAQWDLDAGDMLYLPPHYAHDGVAVTECFTYSIGFRAPTHQEWVEAFLDHLRDHLTVPGRYADPDLALQAHPAELPAALLHQVERVLQSVRWNAADVLSCVGRYLSEPKPHLFFTPPHPALSRHAFARAVQKEGLRLDPRSRILYRGQWFFFNGEARACPGTARTPLIHLADRHQLPPGPLPATALPWLHEAYQAGWIHLGPEQSPSVS